MRPRLPHKIYTPTPIATALKEASTRLAEAGCDSSGLDAELLLAEVLGVDRARLISHSEELLTAEQSEQFGRSVERRGGREPVAYILGRKHFRRIELRVDRRVLIPRPETELLVELALELPSGSEVLEVGTGSGAVALALKDERPDLEVTATDLSADALAVAEVNAQELGLDVMFVQSDLLDDVSGEFDGIFANPPYVADVDYEQLEAEILEFEPAVALSAGPDGLEYYRRLIPQLKVARKLVGLEVGVRQAAAVSQLLRAEGLSAVESISDLAGIERVVAARR